MLGIGCHEDVIILPSLFVARYVEIKTLMAPAHPFITCTLNEWLTPAEGVHETRECERGHPAISTCLLDYLIAIAAGRKFQEKSSRSLTVS